ncbi:unnamed protein product [Allacma fusca]|uniref:Uncharacterized protein n=1 Tax=Allacma fusca TaxID=39272 RepID=A0A8J2KGX6_9HEXA|nr:unnamed protein product [Allacma fusca]
MYEYYWCQNGLYLHYWILMYSLHAADKTLTKCGKEHSITAKHWFQSHSVCVWYLRVETTRVLLLVYTKLQGSKLQLSSHKTSQVTSSWIDCHHSVGLMLSDCFDMSLTPKMIH